MPIEMSAVTGMKLDTRNADGIGCSSTGCTARLHVHCALAIAAALGRSAPAAVSADGATAGRRVGYDAEVVRIADGVVVVD